MPNDIPNDISLVIQYHTVPSERRNSGAVQNHKP